MNSKQNSGDIYINYIIYTLIFLECVKATQSLAEDKEWNCKGAQGFEDEIVEGERSKQITITKEQKVFYSTQQNDLISSRSGHSALLRWQFNPSNGQDYWLKKIIT